MRYLCLGYHDNKQWNIMAQSRRYELLRETFSYQEVLRKNGNFIEGRSLQPVSTTIRFENEKIRVTDGPFAETREQLGGVMLLEADDLNHAIQLMSQLPCMRVGGSVEIRPINETLSE